MSHVCDANRIWHDKEIPSSLRCPKLLWLLVFVVWGNIMTFDEDSEKLLWNEWKFFPLLCPLRRVNLFSYPNFLGMHDSSVLSCFPLSTHIPLLYPRHSFHRGSLIDPKSDHSVSKVVQPFFFKGFKVLCKVHILNPFKNRRPQTWKLLLFLYYLDVFHVVNSRVLHEHLSHELTMRYLIFEKIKLFQSCSLLPLL